MTKHHQLIAGPETIHWGYYDAKLKPVLSVDFHITQLVNGNKGVHATIAKSIVD